MASQRPKIILPELDVVRIEHLVERLPAEQRKQYDGLLEELYRCRVVPSEEVPDDVVTMNSKVQYTRADTQKQSELTLCYPDKLAETEGAVSILAPIGSALIGLSVGQTIDWPLPDGKSTELHIDAVLYQPEREGEYKL